MEKQLKEIKWEMITANHFLGRLEGYEVRVHPFTNIYPYWIILKDGVIDDATRHSPVTTDFNKELACKVQAEKRLHQS